MKRILLCSYSVFAAVHFASPALGQETNLPSSTELVRRGHAEFSSNHWEAAEQLFRKAIELDSQNVRGYGGLGRSLYELGRYAESTAALERALALNPNFTNGWFALGSSYYSSENYQKAAEAYQKYLSFDSGNDGAYSWLCRSLVRLERFEEAETACRRAISINSASSFYYSDLGYCQVQLRRYDDGIKSFRQALALNPKDAYAYLWWGICHYHKKAYQEAVDSLRQCLSIEPTNFDGHSWLGFSQYELRRYDAAATSLQKALQLRPQDFEANYWRGLSLLHAGRFGEATANFEKAYESRKGNKSMRYWLFYCYLLASQYDKAYRLFPAVFAFGGGVLMLGYLIGLTILLRFSFKVRSDPSPGFGFSLAWLVLFFEGQLALIVCLGLLSLIKISESPLAGMVLAGVPLIIVAPKAFARQPWGGPFAWPPRLGTAKIICLSLLFLILAQFIGSWCAVWLARLLHRPVTGQEIVPFIKYALNANPLTAFLSIALVGPITEEILFRGLIYGALEKRLRVVGAILVSSSLFAFVHLQVVYFLPILCLGMVLGWARWKTGSLGLPILMHILNNGFSLIMLRFFEKNS